MQKIVGRGYKSPFINAVNLKLKKADLDALQADEYGNIRLTLFVNDLPPRTDGKRDCDYIIKVDGKYQEPIL